MICPKCGEVNSSNFLFCGMCGTILEPARRATAAVPQPRAEESQPAVIRDPEPARPAAPLPAASPLPRAANGPVPSISGPSLLGLDQGSSVDDFRERAFSGLATYGRPEEPRSAGKEILLTILLLAALGGAGWWTYKNYIGVTGLRKVTVTTPPPEAAPTPTDNAAAKIEKNEAKDAPVPSEHDAADANTPPPAKPPGETTAPAETKAPAEPATEPAAKSAAPEPSSSRHEVSATRIPPSKTAPSSGNDSGEALFRRGQTYLYGRNGTEDCGNALKYLKLAADQQHANARSMMGTMFATGHCVPRDLPSSYHWFALALRVDPNNSILEKDLTAVWNQMTPPERQMATKASNN